MPTVINLKDITTSDSQVSFAEKINYNFNQLLQLGVGQPGPSGPAGPGGAPGPQGMTGNSGPRGTKWFTYSDLNIADTTKPSDAGFVPPLDLQYGDMYSTKRFEVYEYRNVNGTGTWVNIVNPNTIFTAANSATLIRDFAPAGSGNPNGTRFITFINYLGADRSTSSSNPYFNDMLFLHNFDHSLVAAEFAGANMLNFYTAMNSIYVDHTVSSNDLQVRNHIELGSLYSNNGTKITKNNENLKVKYKIDGDTRLAHFNVSKNDGDDATTLGNFNSAFKFSISKYAAGAHKTLDFALTSSEKTRQFTDLAFEQLDGLTLKLDTTKVGFGIRDLGTPGNFLSLIGSTGTGAPNGIYSNLPFYQIGSAANTAQFHTDVNTLKLLGTNNKSISTGGGELLIDANGAAKIKIKNNTTELFADYGAATETSVKLLPNGRIGAGKTDIQADAGKVPGTVTQSPTANLMVNGSFGAGIRMVLASSIASEMSLRETDMTVILNDLPAGSTDFDLGSSTTSTLRVVIVVNRSSSTVNIKGNGATIGSLIAKQTVVYQSFGDDWQPLLTGPNTFATSGGSGGSGTTTTYWAALTVENIVFHGTFTNGYRTADIKVFFYSDINGTLAVPVNNIEVRVTATDETFIDNTSQGTQQTPWFATCNGGNPHVVFPNVIIYTQEKDQYGPNKEDFHYIKTTTTFNLESKKSVAPNDKQQDGTTVLKYLKVGETP